MSIMLNIKNPTPCLFYSIAKEMNESIENLLLDSHVQKDGLVALSQKNNSDAVIRMTELWCEAASFGMQVTFQENDFPKLGSAIINDADELENILFPNVINEFTSSIIESVVLAKPQISKPLIVGVTAPYTLASVLNGSENFMINCMTEQETCHSFLKNLTSFLTEYIIEYKKAGADGIMLCEPSVAMISPDMMNEFSNSYIERIISEVQDSNFSVIYHNCGAVNPHLETIAKLSAHGFHFGSDVNMKKALDTIPKDRLVMGNIDPRLFLPGENPLEKIAQIKSTCGSYENFVMSTGCDLPPNATDENILKFFEK